MPLVRAFCITGLLAVSTAPAFAATYGPELQGFEYPYPLKHFDFQSQGKSLQMGYMDVPAKGQANGRSVVLMHGKNFCGATWEGSIKALSDAGYRVIAPDQIGFCSSSKPDHYQYSFQQLATNTHQLLETLGIQKATVIGHSTGGMLATRYALMYPEQTEQLAMVNPIGLEDWKALGVPSLTVDQWYARELNVSADGIRKYQLNTYYVGRWKPEYERWVDMYAGLSNGPGHTLVAHPITPPSARTLRRQQSRPSSATMPCWASKWPS
jgi:pimeloyl-ACP methyl ester carboxylesterase